MRDGQWACDIWTAQQAYGNGEKTNCILNFYTRYIEDRNHISLLSTFSKFWRVDDNNVNLLFNWELSKTCWDRILDLWAFNELIFTTFDKNLLMKMLQYKHIGQYKSLIFVKKEFFIKIRFVNSTNCFHNLLTNK